jgi:hypothetical protein
MESCRPTGCTSTSRSIESAWSRYHANHCGCDRHWWDHALAAGFEVSKRNRYGGYITLVGHGFERHHGPAVGGRDRHPGRLRTWMRGRGGEARNCS